MRTRGLVTFSTSCFVLSIISYTLFFSLSFLLHLKIFFFMVDAYKILQQNRQNQLWFHYINSHFNFSMFIFFLLQWHIFCHKFWSARLLLTMNSINLQLKDINSLHFSLPSNFTPSVSNPNFLINQDPLFCLVVKESFGPNNCWSHGSLQQTSFTENGWPHPL